MAQKNIFDTETNHPDFESLFGDDSGGTLAEIPEEDHIEDQTEAEGQNLDSVGFPEITKFLETTPHNAFDDPGYYKTALSGEGDISQRVHNILQKYLNTKDPKDKSVFRQQLIPAYWEFLLSVGRKAPGKLSEPKKFLLRFGLLHPSFLKPEMRTFFHR